MHPIFLVLTFNKSLIVCDTYNTQIPPAVCFSQQCEGPNCIHTSYERHRRCIGSICNTDDDDLGGGVIGSPPPTPRPTLSPSTSMPTTSIPTIVGYTYPPTTTAPTSLPPTKSPSIALPQVCPVSNTCDCSVVEATTTNITVQVSSECLGGGFLSGNSTPTELDKVTFGDCSLNYIYEYNGENITICYEEIFESEILYENNSEELSSNGYNILMTTITVIISIIVISLFICLLAFLIKKNRHNKDKTIF